MTTPFSNKSHCLNKGKIIITLKINSMKKEISAAELIQLLCDLEDLEITSLESLVLEGAMNAGFITKGDSVTNLYRRAWIKKVTEHANDAYKLEDVTTGENLAATINNVKALLKARETKVNEILELLAKQILDAVPPYKS
ncbi:hypothetical protein [Vibrio harveyi]|uniref:hypothetical protein n=1 Tax=Vibrio harveyi TaxID=669 RepID=UPI002162207B|nr:hypothetical protein [Vibrio harveyi]